MIKERQIESALESIREVKAADWKITNPKVTPCELATVLCATTYDHSWNEFVPNTHKVHERYANDVRVIRVCEYCGAVEFEILNDTLTVTYNAHVDLDTIFDPIQLLDYENFCANFSGNFNEKEYIEELPRSLRLTIELALEKYSAYLGDFVS